MLAIFLDIETSGLDLFKHRVLEIAFQIVDLQTGELHYDYSTVLRQPLEVWEKRDPKSVEVNGFTWEKILTGKEEALVGQEIKEIFTACQIQRGKAVYICQNPGFDRGFFSQLIEVSYQERCSWPYHWLDFASMYWALRMQHFKAEQQDIPQKMNLSKNAIAQEYLLPLEPYPHSARNGVDHLILCYRTVVGFREARKPVPSPH